MVFNDAKCLSVFHPLLPGPVCDDGVGTVYKK